MNKNLNNKNIFFVCCFILIEFIFIIFTTTKLCFGESDNISLNNNINIHQYFDNNSNLLYLPKDKFIATAIDTFEIIDSIDTHRVHLHGLAMGGGYLWVVRGNPTMIDSVLMVDFINKKIIGGLELPRDLSLRTQGIIYDSLSPKGPFIWCSDDKEPGLIYKYHIKNNSVVQQFISPDKWPDGIAMKDSIIWISGNSSDSIITLNPRTRKFNFLFEKVHYGGNLSFGFDSEFGSFLWMAEYDYFSDNDFIHKVDIVSGEIFQTFKSPGGNPMGLAYDEESPGGPYLWNVDSKTGIIYKLKENKQDQNDSLYKNTPLKYYPNPFQNLITFELFLENDEYVSFSIYNLLGKLISVLVEDKLKSGTHKILFNSANNPQGTYYYILHTSSRVESGSLMLLR